MKTNNEITAAIIELKQAEQNFQYADKEFVNIATLQLVAAEMKVNMLLNLRNQKGPTAMDPCARDNSLTKLFKGIVPQKEQTVKREIKVKVINSTNSLGKHLFAIGKNF